MASRGDKRGGDFVPESRHRVGLFLLLDVIFGVVLPLGYLLNRSQYGSWLRAAVGKPPETGPPTTGSPPKSKGKDVEDNPAAGPYFLARLCMQCDNLPCVRGCPVGTTFKRTDGIVTMDHERCIGCRNCIAQCPYSARTFNWSGPPRKKEDLSQAYSMEYNYSHRKGVVEEYSFGPHESCAGKLPACAEKCTMSAVYFSDEYENAIIISMGETIQFSKVTEQGSGFWLLEELVTNPCVYYLPATNRKYSAPGELKAWEKKA
jgi:Fe-S-cluster-containing dehydrogenase component